MSERPTTRLREMLASGDMVVAPFVLNAFHARIAEAAGFAAVYMTGSGTAAERGYADVGLLTQTEMVQNARYVAGAVEVPVVADADTGYGNAINVWRTVREYERAGVSALHIEDQVAPKKCGFFQGKEVVPMEEHVQKVRAALDARRDKEMVIIARTDALAVHGWEDTARRCRAYHDAGADLVFVDGIATAEDLAVYARELADLPRMLNAGESAVTVAEAKRLGFRLMLGCYTMSVVYDAVRSAMEELRDTGTVAGVPQRRMEIASLLGLDRVYEMEQEYRASQPASS